MPHEVENASFTPLIFTTTGGMGDAATQFYRRLVNLLSAKHSLSYGIVMGWLRCLHMVATRFFNGSSFH